MIRWTYGLMTVPERRLEPLPATLASLARAGFDAPHLFVDGCSDSAEYRPLLLEKRIGGLTCRSERVGVAGNWILALYELYCLQPAYERYAIFQDDFVTYPRLREYLDKCKYPEKGYWNCYTMPSNQIIADQAVRIEGKKIEGWYLSAQNGRGAVALVFDLLTVTTLLANQELVDRPQDVRRGKVSIDGGVINVLKKVGWTEWVHNPSLTQHTGTVSTLGHNCRSAISFRGEGFDAMSLMK